MYIIPGAEGSLRTILITFLRMDNQISLLREKKAINKSLKVRIGDDMTNSTRVLNRLNQHDNIISSWYLIVIYMDKTRKELDIGLKYLMT